MYLSALISKIPKANKYYFSSGIAIVRFIIRTKSSKSPAPSSFKCVNIFSAIFSGYRIQRRLRIILAFISTRFWVWCFPVISLKALCMPMSVWSSFCGMTRTLLTARFAATASMFVLIFGSSFPWQGLRALPTASKILGAAGAEESEAGSFKFTTSENAFFPAFDLFDFGDVGSFASVDAAKIFMPGSLKPAFGAFSSETGGSYDPISWDWFLLATLGLSTVLPICVALSRRLPFLPFFASGDSTLLLNEGCLL